MTRMPIDEDKTNNKFLVEPDRVIIFDQLAESVLFDQLDYSDAPQVSVAEFKEQFDIVGRKFLQPDEDFYQGVNFLTVIRRKTDQALFAYEVWTPVSDHGEPYFEANGDQHGFEWEYPDDFDWDNDYRPETYVFLPVKPIFLPGYKFVKESK